MQQIDQLGFIEDLDLAVIDLGRRNHRSHITRQNLCFEGALKRPVQDAMWMTDRSGG
jgi:hypothetical protein